MLRELTATRPAPPAVAPAPSMPPLLSVRHLDKFYRARRGDHVTALADVSFDVAPGEFITLVGPSGCGKTTLLKILMGTLGRSAGTVTLSGRDVAGPSASVAPVFQTPVLLPWRTVLDNILLPLELRGARTAEAERRTADYLKLVGLDGFASKYPGELSGGMQQRVAIGRALANDPAVLLMDEPFGALDAMTRERLNVELLRIWTSERKTVLLVTHSIAEAVFLADRVFVMTPRPGCLREIIPIDLPRPRTLDMMTSAAFGTYVGAIRAHFDAQGDF